MSKKLIIFGCSLVVFFIGSGAVLGDISVNYNYDLAADGTMTTPYSSPIVETFNSYPTLDQPQWTWTGDGIGRLGSDEAGRPYSMDYAAPYNDDAMVAPDQTYYYAVPESVPADYVQGEEPTGDWWWSQVNFNLPEGEHYDYLGLFWGSIDTYNTFEFMNGVDVVGIFKGSDLAAYPNGNQSAAGQNFYVNFYDLPDFDAVRFISTNYAFEFDNLAVGINPVPVPGAVLLGILGLGVAGMKLRRLA